MQLRSGVGLGLGFGLENKKDKKKIKGTTKPLLATLDISRIHSAFDGNSASLEDQNCLGVLSS